MIIEPGDGQVQRHAPAKRPSSFDDLEREMVVQGEDRGRVGASQEPTDALDVFLFRDPVVVPPTRPHPNAIEPEVGMIGDASRRQRLLVPLESLGDRRRREIVGRHEGDAAMALIEEVGNGGEGAAHVVGEHCVEGMADQVPLNRRSAGRPPRASRRGPGRAHSRWGRR